MSNGATKCFVIMPFSGTTIRHTTEYWTEFYEDYLKPLIEKNAKVEAYRSQALRGDILDQIIKDLVHADIVVADLTDANPNVYWELGVRQSFAHRTITIIESGQKLPFDISMKGSLEYHLQSATKMKAFENQFQSAIDDCLNHPDRPDSHVMKAITGRGTIYEIVHHEESERRLNAFLAELERNLKVLEQVTKIAHANERVKDPNGWTFTTKRFRLLALELLITDRYLDADSAFYASATNLYNRINIWNEQLPIWQLRPSRTQKWIISALGLKPPRTPIKTAIANFEKRVIAERDALKKRL